MTLSEEQSKQVERQMSAAWEKFYSPGMGSKEAKAFKAAWKRAYYEAWHAGYLARLENRSVTEGPADPDAPDRSRRRPRKLYKECMCFCHLELGGGIHKGTKCVCNKGQGYDDGSDHVRVVY